MGAGASFEGGDGPGHGHERGNYWCHSCNLQVEIPRGADMSCPHCRGSFLEESGDHSIVNFGGSHHHGPSHSHAMVTNGERNQLNLEQSRRFANAAIMLRILEFQLRDELEVLQNNYRSQEEEKQKKMLTPCMLASVKDVFVTLDKMCDQPCCPICSEDFKESEELSCLPCDHLYHSECVMPWLEMKRNCPICRFELVSNVPTVDELMLLDESQLVKHFSTHDVELPTSDGASKMDLAEALHSFYATDHAREEERTSSLSIASYNRNVPFGSPFGGEGDVGGGPRIVSPSNALESNFQLMRLGMALANDPEIGGLERGGRTMVHTSTVSPYAHSTQQVGMSPNMANSSSSMSGMRIVSRPIMISHQQTSRTMPHMGASSDDDYDRGRMVGMTGLTAAIRNRESQQEFEQVEREGNGPFDALFPSDTDTFPDLNEMERIGSYSSSIAAAGPQYAAAPLNSSGSPQIISQIPVSRTFVLRSAGSGPGGMGTAYVVTPVSQPDAGAGAEMIETSDLIQLAPSPHAHAPAGGYGGGSGSGGNYADRMDS